VGEIEEMLAIFGRALDETEAWAAKRGLV